MSERKLYFPGLGGNRYEIELEELQRQAYKGKIKRDDKIIVVKIKNGVTSEIETTCGQIRVVSDAFDQGEADRKAEAERKAAEKRAKEEARIARKREKEAVAEQRLAQQRDFARPQFYSSLTDETDKRLMAQDRLFQLARRAVKRFIAYVLTIAIIGAACVCIFGAYLAFNIKYTITYDSVYETVYERTYAKIYDETYKEVYKEVYDREMKKKLEEEERKEKEKGKPKTYEEINEELADLFKPTVDMVAKKEADKAAKLAATEPAEEAATEQATNKALAAGTWAAFVSFSRKAFTSAIIITLSYFFLKFFFDIPLMIARYLAETVKLTVSNAGQNINSQSLAASPQNPVNTVPPQNFTFPR